MNNFAVITKAEQDVAKAKAHLSVLKQKINDSKAKLEEAKKDYDDNINAVSSDNSGIHEYILSVDLIKVELKKAEDVREGLRQNCILSATEKGEYYPCLIGRSSDITTLKNGTITVIEK